MNSTDPLGLQSLTICFWGLGGIVLPLGDGLYGLLIGLVPEGCITIDGGFGLIPGGGSGQPQQKTADDCRKDMQSLANNLALAEAITGDIFVKAIQFGGGERATALSQSFFDLLKQYPPGSINQDNRQEVATKFGDLGTQAPSLFADDDDGRRAARQTHRAASRGRDLTSSLKVEAEGLARECADADLTEREKLELAGIAARARYVDDTYGNFYRGVVLGSLR